MSLDDILKEDGPLATLRSKGYAVESPPDPQPPEDSQSEQSPPTPPGPEAL